jgi:hemerythrin
MEINITQYTKACISTEEQKRITLDYLYRNFRWSKNHFIEDEQVMKKMEYATSHPWTEEEFVREAQEDDYFVAGLIKLINKLS